MEKSDFLLIFASNKSNVMENNNFQSSIHLSVYVFKEAEHYTAWCPALDLCGCDNTQEGAQNDFVYVLNEYLKYQIENGTMQEDLAKLGWKDGKAPSFAQQMKRYPELRRIIEGQGNYYCYTKDVTPETATA